MNTIHPTRRAVLASSVALIGFLFPSPLALQAKELLDNGSFNSPSAWTVVPPQDANWTCIANGEAHLHPYPSGYVGVVIKQKLLDSLTSSRRIQFSAVMTKVQAPAGNTISFTLTYLDASNGSRQIVILSPSNDSIGSQTHLAATIDLPTTARRIIEFSVNKASSGMFTLQSVSLDLLAAVASPEIIVEQPVGSGLTDGTAKRSFGTVKVGKIGAAKTFTIRNAGNANLSGLVITTTGIHAKDFIVTKPAKTALVPSTSTTFKVTFKPKAKGTRNAVIHIKNNDVNENPFDIKLAGLAAAP